MTFQLYKIKKITKKTEMLWDAAVAAGGELNKIARTNELDLIEQRGQKMIDCIYDYMENRGIFTQRMKKNIKRALTEAGIR